MGRAYLGLAVAAIAWGASFVATKRAVSEVSPATVVWARFGMGVLVLGAAVALRRQWALPPRRELPFFVLLGFLGVTLHQWLQSNGLRTATATTSSWIVTTIPIFTALLGFLVLKERLHPVRIAGIVLAAVGVLVVVSRGVRETLTKEQLTVALRHERAHGEAHDNFKRLLILLTPDALPFVRGMGAIERGWSRLAEWAADDRAVRGSRRRSLALASALVRVARMGAAPHAPELATHLLGSPADLAARVERLLEGREAPALRPRVWPVVAMAVCGTVVAVQPSALALVHEALEALAH